MRARVDAGADQHDRDRGGKQERSRGGVPAPIVGQHYQPEAAQTSRRKRAASVPAASRKSAPLSL